MSHRIPLALTSAVLVIAGCAASDPAEGEVNGAEETTVESEDAISCGSKTGTVDGYTTVCACGDYSLPCTATQSRTISYVCKKDYWGVYRWAKIYATRSGTWWPNGFSASTGWTQHTSAPTYGLCTP